MSAERVRVRPATPDDDAELLKLDLVSWPPGTGFPSFRERQRDTFFDDRAGPEHHLVAEFQGRLIGYVRLVPASHIPEASHVLGIFGLVVAEHARGRGVASALLHEAEKLARARGARKVILHVLASNPGARRLYERHGYTVEGHHRDAFLIDGGYVDDIAMAKFLDP